MTDIKPFKREEGSRLVKLTNKNIEDILKNGETYVDCGNNIFKKITTEDCKDLLVSENTYNRMKKAYNVPGKSTS